MNFVPGAGSLIVVIWGIVSKERTRHALIKLVVASRLREGEGGGDESWKEDCKNAMLLCFKLH